MDISVLRELIKPELLILVPFCWVVGKFIRQGKMFENKIIPSILWSIGVIFSFLYLMFMVKSDYDLVQTIISSIVNGSFISAIAVFGNEQLKQFKK